MPKYTIEEYDGRASVGWGPVRMPTHEITVTWEGEDRPPFLPPGALLVPPGATSGGGEHHWQVLIPIHYAVAEGECYSYLVREVTP